MNDIDYTQTGTYLPQATPQERSDRRAQAVLELQNAIGNAHEVLLSATTVFPFTLFPDTITLDRAKLTVTHRLFFKMGEVFSIRIEDVLNVTADVGPFFGSLKISTRFFDAQQKPYEIHYLWREDALRIKRVVQGYIIASKKQVDCAALRTKELVAVLDKLGRNEAADHV
jgi:hypothetical protein